LYSHEQEASVRLANKQFGLAIYYLSPVISPTGKKKRGNITFSLDIQASQYHLARWLIFAPFKLLAYFILQCKLPELILVLEKTCSTFSSTSHNKQAQNPGYFSKLHP
jgi:hypothetical protein